MFPELVPYLLDSSFNSLFSFNLEKDWESYLYTVLYLTSSVITANSQASCISNSSLVKEDRNPPLPPSLSFYDKDTVGWQQQCQWLSLLRLPIYQVPYIHHFTYPQDILFGGFVLLHSTILLKGRLRHHTVIWLTQDCRKEPIFKVMSL